MQKNIGTVLKRALPVAVLLLAAIQWIPVNRSNPQLETEIGVSAEVGAVLKRACYDCHSNQTVWPWYSRVAPFSWLIAHDVHHGREEMNFSTWNRYSGKQQQRLLREIWDEVDEGGMPPWFYLPLHPAARLSDGDLRVLQSWSRTAAATSEAEPR